jgi:hypothetical protein
MRDALSRMVQDWTSMSQAITQIVTRGIDSLNDDLVKAMTGKGKAADFGKTFSEAGSGLLKASLQKLEGGALHKLGFGKADGSKNNPWHVIVDTAGGTINPGSGGLPPWIQPFFGGHPQVGGGQSQPSGGGGGGGSVWQKLLGAFIPGLGGLGKGAGGGGPIDYDGYFQGGFAGGGDFMANRPMLVGETGPEVLTPGMSGHITPNNQLTGGGASGDTHIHIDARGSSDPMAVHAAIRRALPHAVAASVQAVHKSNARRAGGHR